MSTVDIVRQIAEEVATTEGWTGLVRVEAFIAGYVACDAALGETDRANKRLLESRDQRIKELEAELASWTPCLPDV